MGEVVLKPFTINGRRFSQKTVLNLKDELTLDLLRKQGLVGKASEKKEDEKKASEKKEDEKKEDEKQ